MTIAYCLFALSQTICLVYILYMLTELDKDTKLTRLHCMKQEQATQRAVTYINENINKEKEN